MRSTFFRPFVGIIFVCHTVSEKIIIIWLLWNHPLCVLCMQLYLNVFFPVELSAASGLYCLIIDLNDLPNPSCMMLYNLLILHCLPFYSSFVSLCQILISDQLQPLMSPLLSLNLEWQTLEWCSIIVSWTYEQCIPFHSPSQIQLCHVFWNHKTYEYWNCISSCVCYQTSRNMCV